MGFFTFDSLHKLWSVWELRGIILFSLFLQTFLILFSPLRTKTSNIFITGSLWLAYLLADWAATFAVGLISHSQGDTTIEKTVSDLMGFWAPILISHLGGPDTITALALEDNELWLRHLLQLASQLAATGYVLYKIPGTELLAPTLLVLCAGLIKYGERVRSLYFASVNKFRSSLLTEPDPGPNYSKLMEEYTMRIDARLPADIEHVIEPELEFVFSSDVATTKDRTELQMVQDAYKWFKRFKGLVADLIFSKDDWRETRDFYSKRNPEQAFRLVEIELNFIYEVLYTKMAVIHEWVGYFFRLVGFTMVTVALCLWYLKDKSLFTRYDVNITYTLLGGAMVLDAIAFFMLVFSDWSVAHVKIKGQENELEDETSAVGAESQNNNTPIVGNEPQNNNTSIVGNESQDKSTAARKNEAAQQSQSRRRRLLNAYLAISRRRWSKFTEKNKTALSKWVLGIFGCLSAEDKDRETIPFLVLASRIFYRRWSENIQQFNLIDYCVNVRNETVEMVYEGLGLKDILDGNKYVTARWFSESLRDTIFSEMKAKCDAMQDIKKAAAICNARGEWVLENDEKIVIDPKFDMAEWITKVDFDESLILWHIATEICYNQDLDKNVQQQQTEREISKIISDYMLYLLIRQPKIMTAVAGIGQFRFRDTCSEARKFLTSLVLKDPKKKRIRSACSKLIEVSTDILPKEAKGDRSKSVLFEGSRLAKELIKNLGDTKWIVIHKVWVEMLGYAATHCSGNTHAAQLSKGGQLITLVWLLMVHLGLGQQYLINEGNVRAKLVIGR